MASEQVWVVAACFNEAEVISVFLERVMALPEVNHLLLIDDGSSDATVAVIRAWQKSHADQAVTLLELTCNFGKEAAMLAGLDYANGRRAPHQAIAQQAVQQRHHGHCGGVLLQRCSRASISRQACCS